MRRNNSSLPTPSVHPALPGRRAARRVCRWIAVLAGVGILVGCSSSSGSGPSTTVAPTAVISDDAASSPPPSSPASTPASTTPTTERAGSSLVATSTRKAQPRPTVKSTPTPVAPAKPGVVDDPLTGGRSSTNAVIAVKIDNTFFEVPQFGVSDADIVFVEQVEGGLTRLIAVFHTVTSVEVGPVRSVRSTDAQLLPVFGKPALVFSGGAGGPLADLAKSSILDTSGAGDAYFRSDAAYGSYNLHADLSRIATLPGIGPVRSIGMKFGPNDPRVNRARTVGQLAITMQAGQTDFLFQGGRYVRTRDGSPVSDYQGRLEAPDNLLVMHVIDEPDGTVDSVGAPSFLSHTVGSGNATLYRNGRAIDGFWGRPAAGRPFQFIASSDRHSMPFRPGRTWVILAPQNAVVTES